MAPAPDLPLLPPLDVPRDLVAGDGRKEHAKSPQEAELWNLDPNSQGRRVAKEGGRSTHKGGGGEEAKPSRSSRGRSKDRTAEGPGESTQPAGATVLPHTNGNSRDEVDPRPWEQDPGSGDSRLAPPSKSGTAGRKTTVSPGPWKIPGSDKLPSALRAGTSTLSR